MITDKNDKNLTTMWQNMQYCKTCKCCVEKTLEDNWVINCFIFNKALKSICRKQL